MNKQQKVIILCTLLVVLLLLIFPPFNKISNQDGRKEFIGHRFVYSAVLYSTDRDYDYNDWVSVFINPIRFITYVFIVIVIALIFFIIAKDNNLNFDKGFFRLVLILSPIIGLILAGYIIVEEGFLPALIVFLGISLMGLISFYLFKYIIIKLLKFILDGFTKKIKKIT